MKWRYFPFKYYDIYERIALNDVVLDYVKETGYGVISFTGWDSNCVNVGYSQKIRDVVNLDECTKKQIKLVRRKSSGGVTLLSKNDLSWGITVPETYFEGKPLQEIYEYATSKIITALAKIDIGAWHKPINDVMTDSGKISGSALRKDNGVIQLHGTLIYDMDKKLLPSLLRPENDHQKEDKIKEIDKNVISIKELSSINFDELKQVLATELLKDKTFFEKHFTEEELEIAKEKSNFLKSEEWLFKF